MLRGAAGFKPIESDGAVRAAIPRVLQDALQQLADAQVAEMEVAGRECAGIERAYTR